MNYKDICMATHVIGRPILKFHSEFLLSYNLIALIINYHNSNVSSPEFTDFIFKAMVWCLCSLNNANSIHEIDINPAPPTHTHTEGKKTYSKVQKNSNA